ncbi:MAG: hypothetical protein E7602_07445 [Ruminococcaceae bacterium]|nr:hypothetical protein [Oscillospiraceae bacterium]
MKKSFWIYILALVLGLTLLCGCGEIDTSTDTETDTETEIADSSTDTEANTEAVDSSTDTESNIETDTESDTETDSSTETGTKTDTESDTSIDTPIDTNKDINSYQVQKYYKEIGSGYRNYPQEENDYNGEGVYTGVGLTEDYLKDPIFIDSGFEMKQESLYKIVDSFEELEAFSLLNRDEVEEDVFENNYIVVILHYFIGPSSGNQMTLGFYDGFNVYKNGKESVITLDKCYNYGYDATEDERDVYRLHFIVVPKTEMLYTDEVNKININENKVEQYNIEIHKVEAEAEETKAYYFSSSSELKNKLELFDANIFISGPYIAVHLSEEIKTDYLVNEFRYENGEIFITVEIYETTKAYYQHQICGNLIIVSLKPHRGDLEINLPNDIAPECKVNVVFEYFVAME